jgi:hypothetical protein
MGQRQATPDALLHGPFRATEAQALGVTKDQLRSDRFRRIFHDVHVCATIPDSLDVRCRAARLLVPDHAVFCDVTAARLCRLPVPETDQRIHVALPAPTMTTTQTRGIKVHIYALGPQDLWTPEAIGWRMVRPERLYLELARLPRKDLIVMADQLLHHGWTTAPCLETYLDKCSGKRGCRPAREALPHLDPGSESPPETLLRLLIVDAGLPRPAVNEEVRDEDNGDRVARPDLSYPHLKIAIEYEGRHAAPSGVNGDGSAPERPGGAGRPWGCRRPPGRL